MEGIPGITVSSASGRSSPPLARAKTFWLVLRNAAVLGVVLAFGGLAFLGVTNAGDFWFDSADNGWLGGQLWWVAVTGAAGVLVGLLRRAFKMPEHEPGLIQELKAQRVEQAGVPETLVVSAMSLVGGASLGPEKALGSMGGGLGTWISERKRATEEARRTNTLTGMSGAYGGLVSSPILATLLVTELAQPRSAVLNKLFGGLVAASVSFAIFFPIAGATFLGLYELPSYRFEDWHLAAGLVAAAIAVVLAVTIALLRRLTASLEGRTVLGPTIGGVAFGLVGVALPLTLFTAPISSIPRSTNGWRWARVSWSRSSSRRSSASRSACPPASSAALSSRCSSSAERRASPLT